MRRMAAGCLLALLPVLASAQPADTAAVRTLRERQEALRSQLRAALGDEDGSRAAAAGTAAPSQTAEQAADDLADEAEGDEAEAYAAEMHERVVRDLIRRNPGTRASDIVLIEAVPPAADDPQRFGLVFVHFEPDDGSNSASLDILAYRAGSGGPRLAGGVRVWGGGPHDVAHGRGHVEFSTRTPRDSDPRCCPSGWTRFRVDTRTLAATVVGSAD